MRKVIYFFAAIFIMFFLNNCKVLPQNYDEFNEFKESELLNLETEFKEDFER